MNCQEKEGSVCVSVDGRSKLIDEDSFDLNDLLETSNLSEAKIYEEGFVEGLEAGLLRGRTEGWAVGTSQGVNVGVELGEAKGFSEEVAKSVTSGQLKLSSVQEEGRVKKLCEEIVTLVNKFPTSNVDEVDLVRLLEDIRVKETLLREGLSKNSAKSGGKAVKDEGQKYAL